MGRLMTRKRLLRAIDYGRIEEAIRQAERRTSGEIRVSVCPFFWGNVRRVAELAFARLGMTETRQRNGILFFVVPSRRRFAIIGDGGIHARVGQDFWRSVLSANRLEQMRRLQRLGQELRESVALRRRSPKRETIPDTTMAGSSGAVVRRRTSARSRTPSMSGST